MPQAFQSGHAPLPSYQYIYLQLLHNAFFLGSCGAVVLPAKNDLREQSCDQGLAAAAPS
jgi:hypothetical protein